MADNIIQGLNYVAFITITAESENSQESCLQMKILEMPFQKLPEC